MAVSQALSPALGAWQVLLAHTYVDRILEAPSQEEPVQGGPCSFAGWGVRGSMAWTKLTCGQDLLYHL